MTMIRKVDAEDQGTPEQINVDLTHEPPASAKDWIGSADNPKSLIREINAGKIAKIIAVTVTSVVILPPIIAGFITAFKSPEQAQAYAVVVGTLLKSTGEFLSSAFNVLPWVLIYYFLRERRDTSHKSY